VRSRTARVMTTLMRNGRDRRSENPLWADAILERVFLVGTDQRITSGPAATAAASQRDKPRRENRPDTWLHPNASQKSQIPLATRAPSIHGPLRQILQRERMSASLIGRLGSSAFRLSTATVSMSLTGSCFSSESAPGPFHHGVRRRGGTIFRTILPSDERQIQADMRTHLIHRPARDIIPPLGGARSFLLSM